MITIQAEDVYAAIRQLGHNCKTPHIGIKFKQDMRDYHDIPVAGIIIERENALPLEFKTSASALSHLKKLFAQRDKFLKEKEKEFRDKLKKIPAKRK